MLASNAKWKRHGSPLPFPFCVIRDFRTHRKNATRIDARQNDVYDDSRAKRDRVNSWPWVYINMNL